MNKTSYYLGIALKSNKEFVEFLSEMWNKGYIKSFYLDDKNYIAYEKEKDCIFMVVHGKYGDKILNLNKNFVRDAYMDGEDYVMVIPVMLDNPNWKEDFLNGNYSKIFSEREIKEYLSKNNENFKKRNNVLKKDKEHWDSFNEQIFEIYGLKIEEYDDREMEFPPIKKEEILNY